MAKIGEISDNPNLNLVPLLYTKEREGEGFSDLC